jgi:hypothetical protein
MSPDEKRAALLRELRLEIAQDLQALAQAVDQARAAVERPGEPDRSTAEVALVAISLDRAYSSIEAALSRVARTLDRITPAGVSWHASLLHQMTLPIQDVRPAVLRPQTASALEELLGFRHFLRHAYRATLDWGRIRPLAEELPATAEAVRQDLCAFAEFLDSAE